MKLIHKGEYLSYYEIEYADEFGHKKSYEIVSKQGNKHSKTPELTLDKLGKTCNAVSLIIFDKSHEHILLNREFRFGVNRYVYNPTAGLIDKGETPEEAAERELREETGLKLTRIIKQLPPVYVCAPVTDDVLIPFICEAEGEILGSDNIYEEIHSKWCTKQEVLEILNNPDNIFSGYMQAIVYCWANGI